VRRFALSAALFTLVGVAYAQPAAAAYALAVVDGINFTTEGMPKAANEREQFFKFFKEKLAAKGWTVISVVGESFCGATAPNDCLASLAKESPYVLRLTGEGNVKLGYTIHLELYSGATKRTSKNNTICETCFTDDIATFSADIARGLLQDAMTDDGDAKQRESKVQELPTPGTRLDNISTPAGPSTPSLSWLPWSMVAVGAGGLVFGGLAVAEDGKTHGGVPPATSLAPTRGHYSSRSLGILSLIGGGALAIAGTTWLIWPTSKTTALSVSPTHLSFSLRY
jgi:hypothetical protein